MSQPPIAQPLKAYLALRRISITGFAEVIGRSRHYTGRVANGDAEPSAELRRQIAEALDFPEDRLFRPQPPPPARYPGDEAIRQQRNAMNAWPS